VSSFGEVDCSPAPASLLAPDDWPDPTAASAVELSAALETFLARLSEHLRAHPDALPQNVLEALPLELRLKHGL
jgi:hypothetical protein